MEQRPLVVDIRRAGSVREDAGGLTWLEHNGVWKLEPPKDDHGAPLREGFPSDSVTHLNKPRACCFPTADSSALSQPSFSSFNRLSHFCPGGIHALGIYIVPYSLQAL